MSRNGPLLRKSSASFTRPSDTTAYAANDAVNNSTTAPTAMTFSKVANIPGGQGKVIAARIETDLDTVANGSIRLYLFTTSPTMSNDNAEYGILYSERTSRIGFVDFTLETEGTTAGDGAHHYVTAAIPFECGAGVNALYGLLIANGAYTPASAQNVYVEIWTDCNV